MEMILLSMPNISLKVAWDSSVTSMSPLTLTSLKGGALLEGEPPSPLDPPAGCRFSPRCKDTGSEKCRRKPPPLVEIENEHKVACWKYL